MLKILELLVSEWNMQFLVSEWNMHGFIPFRMLYETDLRNLLAFVSSLLVRM
jgi:hypothetical protein